LGPQNIVDSLAERHILIWAEQNNGRPAGVSLEVLQKACELAGDSDKVTAALIGEDCRDAASELVACGAARAFVCEDARLELYQADAYAKILTDLISQTRPSIVLMGSTCIGADLAPTVAARLGTGLTAHCTDLYFEFFDGREQLVMVVPGWQGNMMVKIICPERRPVMATIRPGIFERSRPDRSRKGEVATVKPEIDERDFRARTLERVMEGGESSLEQACVIVSGGFGFFESKGFALLEELARAIGGISAGSRPAVDAGWIPDSRMIGQSGSTVSPELFISIGASGAPHYTTGFGKSKLIAAIDKNPKALVFDIADFGIVGDLNEVIPALIEELKRGNYKKSEEGNQE